MIIADYQPSTIPVTWAESPGRQLSGTAGEGDLALVDTLVEIGTVETPSEFILGAPR
jgi:hypothetical protein